MNLTQFLSKVDELTGLGSKEQMAGFIHDTARLLPEEKREDFVKRFSDLINGQKTKPLEVEKDFEDEYREVLDLLEELEAGERILLEDYNPEYDEWYNSSVEEILYIDNDEVIDSVAQICRFVHKCADRECYAQGEEIGERLFSLEVQTDAEYSGEPLSLGDLVHYELLDVDIKNIALDVLYCIYLSEKGRERAETIYCTISFSHLTDLCIEDLMQHGNQELIDFDKFLDDWIDYLGGRTGNLAQKLFLEAVFLKDDADAALAAAKKYVQIHPGLFLEILKRGLYSQENPEGQKTSARTVNTEKDSEREGELLLSGAAGEPGHIYANMLQIGREALELIDEKYLIRSKIALLMSEYAVRAGDKDTAHFCHIEAFRSQTIPVNYLRVLLNSGDILTDREVMREIYGKVKIATGNYYYGHAAAPELQENKPGVAEMYLIWFLDGRFLDVVEQGMNVKKPLGWSSTFMKKGLAFLLLYFHQGALSDGGLRRMLENVREDFDFTAEKYQQGLSLTTDQKDMELFYSCFQEWKALTPIAEEEKNRILAKIERWISRRVDGIMDANRRNYYGECAAFIAAFGEVKESMGEQGAKQRLMTAYQKKYSRRRAFKDELIRYGWRKQ